jgi:hypothetical protein
MIYIIIQKSILIGFGEAKQTTSTPIIIDKLVNIKNAYALARTGYFVHHSDIFLNKDNI